MYIISPTEKQQEKEKPFWFINKNRRRKQSVKKADQIHSADQGSNRKEHSTKFNEKKKQNKQNGNKFKSVNKICIRFVIYSVSVIWDRIFKKQK